MVFEWFSGDSYYSFDNSIKKLEKYEKKLFDVLSKEEIKEIKKHVDNVIEQFEDLEQRFDKIKERLKDLQILRQKELRVDVYDGLKKSIEKLSESITSLFDKKEELIKYWNSESFKEEKYHEIFLELIEIVKTELKEIHDAKNYIQTLERHKRHIPDEKPGDQITHFENVMGSETFRKQLQGTTEDTARRIYNILRMIGHANWRQRRMDHYNETNLLGVPRGHTGVVTKILFYVGDDGIVRLCKFFVGQHDVYEARLKFEKKEDYEKQDFARVLQVA